MSSKSEHEIAQHIKVSLLVS